MKIHFLKVKDWLLMTAMGLVGLTSCHSAKQVAEDPQPAPDTTSRQERFDPGKAAVMYGVPQMDYEVKGRVVDPQGNPVKGMQVVLVNQTIDVSPDHLQEDNRYVREYIRNASDTTNENGEYKVRASDVPVDQQRLMVRDIDGEENGSFKDRMLDVTFTDEDQTEKGRNWYLGVRAKEVDVTVEEK